MKAGSDRSYTVEFRDSAVKQVTEGGRSMSAVARSLGLSYFPCNLVRLALKSRFATSTYKTSPKRSGRRSASC